MGGSEATGPLAMAAGERGGPGRTWINNTNANSYSVFATIYYELLIIYYLLLIVTHP